MTVVIAKSYPDAATLKLVADIQFREPYASGAMNRKLRGILFPGIYSGFYPVPGAGLNLKITSLSATDQTGTASLDFGMYQISVRHQSDLTVALTAGTNKIVALQAMYGIGVETYQVNSDSTIQAAEIVLLDINATLATNQLEICKVRIPAGATQLTAAMIDLSGRKVRRVGIEFSSEIDKTDEDVAATSLAVKRAIASIVDSAPTALNTLKKIAAAINNDPAFYTTLTDLLALKAPLASPALTGTPTAPTAAQTVNNTQIATTAFVKAALAALVDSAPGTLDTLNELATALGNDPNFATTMTNLLALKAPLASPALTGTPTAPTVAQTVNNTQIATTAFVQAAIAALNTTINTALNLKAPLASPALTGTPTAPTAAQTANNTQIATTAFVKAALAALVDSAPGTLDTLNELATALGNDPNFATTVTNALAGKQPIHAALTSFSGLVGAANKLPYFVGKDLLVLADFTAFARTLLSRSSAALVRADLNILSGPGWYKLGDLLIQYGTIDFTGATTKTVNFPIRYPTKVDQVIVSDAGWGGGNTWGATEQQPIGFTAHVNVADEGGQWISFGS